jgi:hypothetical protein
VRALAIASENSLAIAIDLVVALSIAIDRSLEIERAFFRDRGLVLARDLAIARSSERSREIARSLKLELALARARDLAIATTPAVGFDYALYYAWRYATLFTRRSLPRRNNDWLAAMQGFPDLLEGVIDLAHKAGMVGEVRRLRALSAPASTASGWDWRQHADALFVILRNERDLAHEWEFTKEEIDALNDYFYANELLVQCIQVAVVSDRQTILQGLLLPPKD